jgi:endonuclease/exonuclease/phosphatase (EEP) superfamily protein YafD
MMTAEKRDYSAACLQKTADCTDMILQKRLHYMYKRYPFPIFFLRRFNRKEQIVKLLHFPGIVCCAFFSLLPPLLLSIGLAAFALNSHTGAATDYTSGLHLTSPPPSLDRPLSLRIVTFNIADGYLFTTNRPERMHAIGALLTKLDPDIVGIQESFVEKDRQILLNALAQSRLRYFADYPAATVGNGLLTLSAYPIVETVFHRFQNNNPWYKLHQGDWWAGKGVGLARIRLPSGSRIDIYNLHAQAERNDAANNKVRYLQMGELAAFVNNTRTITNPAFVVGDFNTRMGRPDLQRAVEGARLRPAVTLNSGIDAIFSVETRGYSCKAVETLPITGETNGSAAAIFLSRAPTLKELWLMHYGPGEVTPLSDHSGFMSTVHVSGEQTTTPYVSP